MTNDLIARLRALHVWPQFVADAHADMLLPRQIKGLYAVGHTAHQAADRIEALSAEVERLREALNYYAEDFCELGAAHECCGRLTKWECSGCFARAALKGTSDE